MQTGRGWTYPNRPGGHFTTWVDGAELAMIRRWWGPASIRGVWEAMTFRHGRPLDNYARRLMRLLAAIDDHETAHATTDDAAVYAAARRAVRSIALHSIGSLTGKPRRVTRSQPITYGPPPVGAVHARLDGGEWRWSETGPPRQPALAQPQMAAAVWARARTRLLDGPAVDDIPTGALHVPRGWVVGFRTDAIYLTHDPRWPDDGRPGRYRRKTTVPGPMVAPTNQTQLLALRDGAF
jgi:hypothetical protein